MDVIFNVSLLSKLNCSMTKTPKGFPVVYFHLTFPKHQTSSVFGKKWLYNCQSSSWPESSKMVSVFPKNKLFLFES